MPPARTIFVDTRRIMISILDQAAEQHDATMLRTACYRAAERDVALALAEWVPRDLARLAGHPLTASERKRHQEAIRQMEADGLVLLDARHVKLTDAGRELAEQLRMETAAADG